jgi:Txe/YoeB family toxin of toxin-antitoxin system
VSWGVRFTRQAQKDVRTIAAEPAALKAMAQELFLLLTEDLFRPPSPFEALVGDLSGAFSLRINSQHRLVRQVLHEERVGKMLRLWSHYA